MQDKMEEKIMIAPSIMCISEWHDTKNIFRQLKVNGIAMIHADVMDGKFVPNLMLGTEYQTFKRGNGYSPGYSYDGRKTRRKTGLV